MTNNAYNFIEGFNMNDTMFKTELDYFKANQDELVKKYLGKVLVIKGNSIIGVYGNALEAYLEAQKKNKLGTFMIQPCRPGPSAYTVTISSNVVSVL
jgi:hypothetical protein